MEKSELKAKIFYLCREKFYNHMQKVSAEASSKYPSEPSFIVWRILSLILSNKIEESEELLEPLKLDQNFQLSSLVALMYCHKLRGSDEKELFIKLDAQVREYKRTAVDSDLYYTATILFAFEKYDKALDYITKALNSNSREPDYLCLKGWIEIALSKLSAINNLTVDIFETSSAEDKRNLDGILGLVECLMKKKKYEEATEVLNKTVVRFPANILPLIYKMKLHFTMQNWEQVTESITRVTNIEPYNLDAQIINVLYNICYTAKYDAAANLIRTLQQNLEESEKANSKLFLDLGFLFSRNCGKHQKVLTETCKLVEKATQIEPKNDYFITELAYQYLLLGELNKSLNHFKAAVKLNESSIAALLGMTFCEMKLNGKSEQIKHQVEFLVELQEIEASPLLLYMQAKFADTSKEAIKYLNKACEIQLSKMNLYYYGAEYLRILNPDFLLDVMKEYFLLLPSLNNNSTQNFKNVFKNIEIVLQTITRACPCLQEAVILYAKFKHLNGNSSGALDLLQKTINNSNAVTDEVYLLMAQIQTGIGLHDRAAQNLEICLSQNFQIRDNPLYHYIKGVIEKSGNKLDECIQSFTKVLNLVDGKQILNLKLQAGSYKSMTLAEHTLTYIELIDAHTRASQFHEAAKFLEEATEKFRGTPEESRLLILNAEYAVQNENIESAIDMLNTVPTHDPYYLQAKTKLASIYLEAKRDKHAYLQTYQEMIDSNPEPESYMLLGDAHMHILEVEKALEMYEKALQMDQNNSEFLSKMGKALIKTHFYGRAVQFYKDAIQSTKQPDLKLQLAELYVEMDQLDKAEILIRAELEAANESNEEDVVALYFRAKLLDLLASIQENSSNLNGALTTIRTIRDIQNRIVKQLSFEQSNVPQAEKDALVNINMKLARLSTEMKATDQAIRYYNEALHVMPDNLDVLVALAKMHMQTNNFDLCQQTCTTLLKIEAENEEALIMMADIAFRKINFDMASFHFTNLLSKQPCNWLALTHLIEVVRRTGDINQAQPYLNSAEKLYSVPLKEPGFCYCTALYQWYSGNLNGALKNFNSVRSEEQWGKQALYSMVEICLNPEDDLLCDQFFDSDDLDYRDSRTMALKTAERLLKELKQKYNKSADNALDIRLFGNFLLLATKEKVNIEHALEDFIAISSQEQHRENVKSIFGMATAHTLLKQGQRAKTQLKRVSKNTWNFADAEYLERCWLLLGDYYIQSAKYDMALDLVKRVLYHNKSCVKAYEYAGFIAEKEQSYKEAAYNYNNAWKHCNKNNPTIGFKLAFNYMKCKNYADAIDTCHYVLKSNPNYPRIKKDILDKCITNLRT